MSDKRAPDDPAMDFSVTYVRPEAVPLAGTYMGHLPPLRADEVRIMARLNAIDAKLDAILKKLGT